MLLNVVFVVELFLIFGQNKLFFLHVFVIVLFLVDLWVMLLQIYLCNLAISVLKTCYYMGARK